MPRVAPHVGLGEDRGRSAGVEHGQLAGLLLGELELRDTAGLAIGTRRLEDLDELQPLTAGGRVLGLELLEDPRLDVERHLGDAPDVGQLVDVAEIVGLHESRAIDLGEELLGRTRRLASREAGGGVDVRDAGARPLHELALRGDHAGRLARCEDGGAAAGDLRRSPCLQARRHPLDCAAEERVEDQLPTEVEDLGITLRPLALEPDRVPVGVAQHVLAPLRLLLELRLQVGRLQGHVLGRHLDRLAEVGAVLLPTRDLPLDAVDDAVLRRGVVVCEGDHLRLELHALLWRGVAEHVERRKQRLGVHVLERGLALAAHRPVLAGPLLDALADLVHERVVVGAVQLFHRVALEPAVRRGNGDGRVRHHAQLRQQRLAAGDLQAPAGAEVDLLLRVRQVLAQAPLELPRALIERREPVVVHLHEVAVDRLQHDPAADDVVDDLAVLDVHPEARERVLDLVVRVGRRDLAVQRRQAAGGRGQGVPDRAGLALGQRQALRSQQLILAQDSQAAWAPRVDRHQPPGVAEGEVVEGAVRVVDEPRLDQDLLTRREDAVDRLALGVVRRQLDLEPSRDVLAVLRDRVDGLGIGHRVLAVSAVDDVGARTTCDLVVAGAGRDAVVAGAAEDLVVGPVAIRVGGLRAEVLDAIIAGAAEQSVIALAGLDAVVAVAAAHDIEARPGVDAIVVPETVDHVVARPCADPVRSLGAGHDVGAAGAAVGVDVLEVDDRDGIGDHVAAVGRARRGGGLGAEIHDPALAGALPVGGVGTGQRHLVGPRASVEAPRAGPGDVDEIVAGPECGIDAVPAHPLDVREVEPVVTRPGVDGERVDPLAVVAVRAGVLEAVRARVARDVSADVVGDVVLLAAVLQEARQLGALPAPAIIGVGVGDALVHAGDRDRLARPSRLARGRDVEAARRRRHRPVVELRRRRGAGGSHGEAGGDGQGET